MRGRVVAGGIVSSAAVLVIGWQLGGQPAATSLGTSTSGPATSGTGDTAGSGGSTGFGGTASGASTASPSPSAGSGTPAGSSTVSGTFDGSTVETRYGPVQVEIVVSAGRITDVKALQLTDQGGRSVEISASAAPILRQEAIAAQSASIQSVSGATYTSEGYTTSLQSAIDRAGL